MRMPPVAVEYDKCGKRVKKIFADPYEAKSFYIQKVKRFRNPKVVRVVQ
jgi:hypothetical protein